MTTPNSDSVTGAALPAPAREAAERIVAAGEAVTAAWASVVDRTLIGCVMASEDETYVDAHSALTDALHEEGVGVARALLALTDEQAAPEGDAVERGARAVYGWASEGATDYDTMPEDERDQCRDCSRAVLDASGLSAEVARLISEHTLRADLLRADLLRAGEETDRLGAEVDRLTTERDAALARLAVYDSTDDDPVYDASDHSRCCAICDSCIVCQQDWPCSVFRLRAEIDDLRGRIAAVEARCQEAVRRKPLHLNPEVSVAKVRAALAPSEPAPPADRHTGPCAFCRRPDCVEKEWPCCSACQDRTTGTHRREPAPPQEKPPRSPLCADRCQAVKDKLKAQNCETCLLAAQERTSAEPCDSRGPRIAGEGQPRCRLIQQHEGSHSAHPDDGWGSMTWHDYPSPGDQPREWAASWSRPPAEGTT